MRSVCRQNAQFDDGHAQRPRWPRVCERHKEGVMTADIMAVGAAGRLHCDSSQVRSWHGALSTSKAMVAAQC